MRVKFFGNLGIQDANTIKNKLGVTVDWRQCQGSRAGTEVDIHEDAYAWIKQRYPALVEEVKETSAITGVAAKPTVAEKKDTTIKADAK
jgi:hypothetical protein